MRITGNSSARMNDACTQADEQTIRETTSKIPRIRAKGQPGCDCADFMTSAVEQSAAKQAVQIFDQRGQGSFNDPPHYPVLHRVVAMGEDIAERNDLTVISDRVDLFWSDLEGTVQRLTNDFEGALAGQAGFVVR